MNVDGPGTAEKDVILDCPDIVNGKDTSLTLALF